jgi:hypothetical protein
VVGPVDQRPVAQAAQRDLGDGGLGAALGGQREDGVDGHRRPEKPNGVQDLQRECVQPVEGPPHRRDRLHPSGECAEVGRHRHDQIGAQPNERGQPVVAEAAQVINKSLHPDPQR